MSDVFLRDPELEPALDAIGLGSADALFGLTADPTATSVVTMLDIAVPGTVGRFHFKRYVYPDWGKSRRLIGRGTLWGRAPEVNEFLALRWLRENDLPAVRPVAAASRTSVGLRLEAHALLTEHVPDANTLAGRLADPEDPLRTERNLRFAVAEVLGRAVARMHLLGFSHRDLFARNVLIGWSGDAPRAWLLDCRRGGRGRRKGPLFDLACLRHDLRDGTAPLGSSEWMHLLAAYSGSTSGLAALDARIERVKVR